MIPRLDHPPRRDRRYRLRPGIYALLVRKDRVLVTHQAQPVPEFQLPGGGIDPGEQPIPALHREVFEETGWHMQLRQRLGAFRRFVFMPEYDLWAEKLCHVYLARPTLRLGPPLEPGHSAHWVPVAQVSALLANPGDKAMVDAWRQRSGV